MTTQKNTLLNDLLEGFNFEGPLKETQKKAFEKFQKIGLPTRKTEAYKYVSFDKTFKLLFEDSQEELLDPNLLKEIEEKASKKPYLVMLNGRFLPSYSKWDLLDTKVVIKDLKEAFKTYGPFLKNALNKMVQDEKDPYALLTISLMKSGLFIYVPSHLQISEPLLIFNVHQKSALSMPSPIVLTNMGKNSQLKMQIETICKAKGFDGALHPLFGFQLDESSIVDVNLYKLKKQLPSFEMYRVVQKKDSQFKMVLASLNCDKQRFDAHIQLQGERASASWLSLCALKGSSEAHSHLLLEHHEESATSRQLVKNIFDDASMGSFEGKIYVHSKAQQTNAYQLNQNCLLSDKAVCYSKPNLEIFADDVSASHGSTTGQLDAEQLFYLRSRGLSEKEAKKMVLESFCVSITRELFSYTLQSRITKALKEFF